MGLCLVSCWWDLLSKVSAGSPVMSPQRPYWSRDWTELAFSGHWGGPPWTRSVCTLDHLHLVCCFSSCTSVLLSTLKMMTDQTPNCIHLYGLFSSLSNGRCRRCSFINTTLSVTYRHPLDTILYKTPIRHNTVSDNKYTPHCIRHQLDTTLYQTPIRHYTVSDIH